MFTYHPSHQYLYRTVITYRPSHQYCYFNIHLPLISPIVVSYCVHLPPNSPKLLPQYSPTTHLNNTCILLGSPTTQLINICTLLCSPTAQLTKTITSIFTYRPSCQNHYLTQSIYRPTHLIKFIGIFIFQCNFSKLLIFNLNPASILPGPHHTNFVNKNKFHTFYTFVSGATKR